MSNVRYPRAAVAVAIGSSDQRSKSPLQRDRPSAPAAPVVLWAFHAFSLPGGGRLVGVRRVSSSQVEVALLEPGEVRI